MAKDNLVVRVRKLLFKKYMKNHNIYIYIYIGVYTTIIVFMINLANLEINY